MFIQHQEVGITKSPVARGARWYFREATCRPCLSQPIYLVVESSSPVTEFTDKDALKAYLKRKRGTFNRPLVYRIKDGHEPVIMTVSRVLAGGLDAGSKRHRS